MPITSQPTIDPTKSPTHKPSVPEQTTMKRQPTTIVPKQNKSDPVQLPSTSKTTDAIPAGAIYSVWAAPVVVSGIITAFVLWKRQKENPDKMDSTGQGIRLEPSSIKPPLPTFKPSYQYQVNDTEDSLYDLTPGDPPNNIEEDEEGYLKPTEEFEGTYDLAVDNSGLKPGYDLAMEVIPEESGNEMEDVILGSEDEEEQSNM
tara:strand:- start:756 stop:1361 length:606 start_codon:yes stop_codon:yes gene_type:complete